MDRIVLERIVSRAALAPSVHNTQPARWLPVPGGIEVMCDTGLILPVGDPDGRDAALSCGAAVEATVIALSADGIAVTVDDLWAGTGSGLRPVARLTFAGDRDPDLMACQLERRYTHRGVFADGSVSLFGWARPDAMLITDPTRKAWLAALNDKVSLQVMRDRSFRRELLNWMRLLPWDRRAAEDGLSAAALRLSPAMAVAARLTLGPLWPLCDALGLSAAVTAEAEATRSAQAIACFHAPLDASPVATGRSYLRMCLEAAHLGMAGWPMAALADTPASRAEIVARIALPADRQLIQVIRFGKVDAAPPPRVRRSAAALIL